MLRGSLRTSLSRSNLVRPAESPAERKFAEVPFCDAERWLRSPGFHCQFVAGVHKLNGSVRPNTDNILGGSNGQTASQLICRWDDLAFLLYALLSAYKCNWRKSLGLNLKSP